MSLKLMYITNSPSVARVCVAAGVDRVFVDMEYIKKSDRQRGRDTVQNRHTVSDVQRMRGVLDASCSAWGQTELLVRCNPWHEATAYYPSSVTEIEAVMAAGADLVMLPYFKTVAEARRFVETVRGRARTVLLIETPEAVDVTDELLALPGVDEVFIGLNDLSIGYGRSFLFELLADGTVERLCRRFRAAGVPYGFGGVCSVGRGLLPAEYVVAEHRRLGSSTAILSRSFCGDVPVSAPHFAVTFIEEVARLRACETFCAGCDAAFLRANAERVRSIVSGIAESRAGCVS